MDPTFVKSHQRPAWGSFSTIFFGSLLLTNYNNNSYTRQPSFKILQSSSNWSVDNIYVLLENTSLIWTYRHCRWRAVKLGLCSAIGTFEQRGCFDPGPRSHHQSHPCVCCKRRRKGAFLWMRQEKPRPHNKDPSLPKGPECQAWVYEIGIWEFRVFSGEKKILGAEFFERVGPPPPLLPLKIHGSLPATSPGEIVLINIRVRILENLYQPNLGYDFWWKTFLVIEYWVRVLQRKEKFIFIKKKTHKKQNKNKNKPKKKNWIRFPLKSTFLLFSVMKFIIFGTRVLRQWYIIRPSKSWIWCFS
jgi:hypothetical protein